MKQFILTVLVCSCFFVLLPWVFAQETVPLTSLPAASPSPVDYPLPYPGILPDHPLYFLKVLRDKVLGVFITSPVRKVEFFILNADKRLNMSLRLLEKGKAELSMKTAHDAANYLAKAEVKIFEVSESDLALNPTKDRLEKSITKHLEKLEDMQKTLSQEPKDKNIAIIAEIKRLKEDFTKRK